MFENKCFHFSVQAYLYIYACTLHQQMTQPFLITELFKISVFDYICNIINKKGAEYESNRNKSKRTRINKGD